MRTTMPQMKVDEGRRELGAYDGTRILDAFQNLRGLFHFKVRANLHTDFLLSSMKVG